MLQPELHRNSGEGWVFFFFQRIFSSDGHKRLPSHETLGTGGRWRGKGGGGSGGDGGSHPELRSIFQKKLTRFRAVVVCWRWQWPL